MRPFLLASLVLVAAPDAMAQAVGQVDGTVTLSSRLATRKPRVRLESAYGAAAAAPRAPVNELVNVVIYLEPARGRAAAEPPRDPLVMRQKNEAFAPHVLPVPAGATVAFPNDDPFFHNVFSLSRARSFDLGRYATGVSKSVRFDKPGIVQVFCHIHSDMRANVVVLATPFFVMPDSSGRYALTGLPAGEYRLVVWHERIRPVERTVHVEAGRTTTVDLAIPLPPPSEAATP